MKFKIVRLSSLPDDVQPCDAAVWQPYSHYFKNKKDERSAFFIEINQLEELTALVQEEGQLILSEGDWGKPTGPPVFEIEIYDGYRE